MVLNIQAQATEEVVIFRWIVNQGLSNHTMVRQDTPPCTGSHFSNAFVPTDRNLVTASVVVGTHNEDGSHVVGISCDHACTHAPQNATIHTNLVAI